MSIILAATHHDPDGRLLAQTERIIPVLGEYLDGIAVFLTPGSLPKVAETLRAAGVICQIGTPDMPVGHVHLGIWRRAALDHGIASFPQAQHYLFCDLDRAMHWGEYYLNELKATLEQIRRYDCTVLGRTERAFRSHPAAQRDTEAIANHVFGLATGLNWDMLAAARGFSARAAQLVVSQSTDDTVGSDCTWPLLVRRAEGMSLHYLATEGMEFETLDRCGEEIAALGGAQAWLDQFDSDPRQWAARTAIAQSEIQALVDFLGTHG